MDKPSQIASIKSALGKHSGGSFLIQAGHVTPLFIKDKKFNTLSDVFPKLFSENDEAAFVFWNNIPVRFHYAYEFYANWDTLIDWFSKITNHAVGGHEVVLATEQYFITIHSSWSQDNMVLESEWTARATDTGMAEVLNKKSKMTISKVEFLREWKTLIYQVVKILEKAGIELTDPKEKEKILIMKKIAVSVEGMGKLYTKSTSVNT